jgi:hypothetical protein
LVGLGFGLLAPWPPRQSRADAQVFPTASSRAEPCLGPVAGEGAKTLAFFYGRTPPPELSFYDQVVVQPDHADATSVAALSRRGVRVFAYLSTGEIGADEAAREGVPEAWLLGTNAAWGTRIADPASPGWRARVVGRAEALAARGFGGLFLDTLDSYVAALPDLAAREQRTRALADLLRTLHARLPRMPLLVNRGFEALPLASGAVCGVVAESLFARWDPARKAFTEVPEQDRTWLLAQLAQVRARDGIGALAVDYLPFSRRAEARDIARRIAALGIAPWVTTPELDVLGVGSLEIVPRRILALYDSAEEPHLPLSSVHRFIATPLEHLGYAVDYADVRGPLPEDPLAGRYAGIVSWFNDDELDSSERYRAWVLRQLDAGIRLAAFDHLGFNADPAFLARLGLAPAQAPRGALHIARADELIGIEAVPQPRRRGIAALRAIAGDVHLSLEDASGARFDEVVTGPFGGVALSPFVIEGGYRGHQRWLLDPFAFLQRALDLPPLPAPDVTTGSGRRILTVHVDGDGFANRAELPGTPLAGQVILDQILRRFPLPTTVSVIEAEVAPGGLNPALSPELERIARAIFALPNVELASHSFSHPFDWEEAEKNTKGSRLPVPSYRFDLDREIAGSIGYINERLAPPGKRVQVFLWTGDALPGAGALARTDQLGLANLNGGNTQATSENPSLTDVSPLGRPAEGHFQVYAPVQNENVYTNLWRSPFFGYRRALETFRLTDHPRRLKTLSIYFHFYSGTKPASLQALREVYRWANRQETLPLTISEYARKAVDFEGAAIARRLDGAFVLRGMRGLRTVRLDPRLGFPDLSRSHGVAGVRDVAQGRYVSLTGADPAVLALSPTLPTQPYLKEANGEVEAFAPGAHGAHLRLRGHQRLRFSVAGSDRPCTLRFPGGVARGVRRGDAQEFRLDRKDSGDATLECG